MMVSRSNFFPSDHQYTTKMSLTRNVDEYYSALGLGCGLEEGVV